MRKLLTLFSAILFVGSMWGTDVTYTFTGKNWTATSGGQAANWTSGKEGAGFSNNGIQVTNNENYTGANGTSPVSFTNVTKVVCTYNTNKSGGAGTIDVKVGSNTAKSVNWAYSGSSDGRTANFTATVNYNTPETGNVKITLNTTTNSIYLVSVTITTAADPSVSAITPTPSSVSLGEAAVDDGSIAIAYTGISDMSNVEDIALYNDAEHSSPFEGDWFVADWTDANKTTIEYIAEANAGAQRQVYIYLYALDDEGEDVETIIPVTQSAYIPVVTAVSNNNDYGTVALSNNDITATPNAGYRIDDDAPYTVTAGTATVVRGTGNKTNQFTVTPSTDCTVQINFEAIPQYTVTWNVNGETSTSQVYEGSKPVSPADPSPCDVTSTSFIGWATAAWNGKLANLDDKTVYTKAADMPAVTDNETVYYAVFAKEISPETWTSTLITSLTSSDIFVFTDGTYAMTNDNGTSSAPATSEVTIANDKITSVVADNLKWQVSGNSTDGYTFYPNGSTTTWLYCNTTAASKSNDNIRVGTGNRKVFVVNNSGYLVTNDTYVDRYVSNYSDSEFRGYINTDNNPISPVFYKYTAGTYEDYMTTCPPCANEVAFTKAGQENGTFELQVGGVAKESIKTCDDDVTVNVVASPATGYELTGVAISDLDGASIAGNVITLDQNTSGDLTVTATFSQSNYTVTMEQDVDAGATLTGATDEAHYGGTINITAEDKAGFIFDGWTASPAVTFADASALETSFTMPNSDVTITANYSKIYTTEEALELESGIDVYVAGIVVGAYSTYSNSYYISDDGSTTNQFICFKGNGVTMTVGNKVLVHGTMGAYKGTPQLAEGYTLVSSSALSSVTISGTATKTEYAKNASFDFAGLIATATWGDDTSLDVTENADWSADPETITAAGNVTVTATWKGKSGSTVVAVTVTPTALDNTEVEGKAVKVLRNGILLIEKNGHTYNAQGQLVK